MLNIYIRHIIRRVRIRAFDWDNATFDEVREFVRSDKNIALSREFDQWFRRNSHIVYERLHGDAEQRRPRRKPKPFGRAV